MRGKKALNKLKNNSSLSDKGSSTIKLHTEPFPRTTSKEVYEAYTDELPSASSTTSTASATTQQKLWSLVINILKWQCFENKGQQQKQGSLPHQLLWAPAV